MTRLIRIAVAAAVLTATAGSSLALAQPTTTTAKESKSFEIIAVNGNQLIVKLPEGTKELDVPADFKFVVNGQPLSVGELKPGMKGTATITTTTTVTPVVVTEVKNGTVMQRSGGSLIVRTDSGIKMFNEGELEKRGVKMVKNGQPAQITDFREGDKLSATIVTTKPPKVMTEKQVHASVAAPAAAAPARAAASSSGASSNTASRSTTSSSGSTAAGGAKTLPKTASSWPALALASLLSLAIGLALTMRRRLFE
jgi:hypothetical protein